MTIGIRYPTELVWSSLGKIIFPALSIPLLPIDLSRVEVMANSSKLDYIAYAYFTVIACFNYARANFTLLLKALSFLDKMKIFSQMKNVTISTLTISS